ncbi:YciI family protein [Streptomyces sp. NPDC055105]|uniref:YciI family protein n=1 Tax=Streptomyces sp. NPDC055105 TaxID=3365719 RepID=UPI0037CFE3A3
MDAVADEHLLWLLGLERDGVVFLSGSLVSREGVGPGSGVTVLRAESEEEARVIAETDAFVRAGLRTVQGYGWRLNKGAIDLRLWLGADAVDWR